MLLIADLLLIFIVYLSLSILVCELTQLPFLLLFLRFEHKTRSISSDIICTSRPAALDHQLTATQVEKVINIQIHG